ncbi:AAA ATPase-like protein [Kitasatospora sp. SolWspMP-SS2h]|uniref:helix-turn-helix transcriptional regulator n=1 Tax=Kitasatospora sp. SolWspMP-SS2h TaxID=1305729 RepID=UPI000DBA6C69|nr:LuxR family transcriptional regulator [Kitasatospora sp. SolWspMP-SS2h]RAJ40384.1 AAA ATPase-like protein [Kitasatospora sp. SolWspMP-SS2h]
MSSTGNDHRRRRTNVGRSVAGAEPARTRNGGPLVGRGRVLEALGGALDRLVARGGTALVKVTGDAGVGRSTVLGEFSRIARAAEAVVLSFRTAEERSEIPLGTFAEGMTGLEELPGLSGVSGGQVVRRSLDAYPPGPLVLVMDDLHMADPQSVETLADLLRHPPRPSTLFVLGYRDRQNTGALLRALGGRAKEMPVEHLHLEPLLEQDYDELLAGVATSVTRRRLHRESGGNPEYLKVLLAEQAVSTAPLDGGLTPQPSRSDCYVAFDKEIAPLAPETRGVAETAAVLGDEFEVGLVAELLGLSSATVLMAIGELIRRDLIRPVVPGQYFAFRHPVVRRSVYHNSELSWRVGMHGRADAALCARGASAMERAPHVEQCTAYGDQEAIGLLESAARAVSLDDPDATCAWLTTALHALPQGPGHDPQRGRLMLQLAEAQALSGRLLDSRHLMHQALEMLPTGDAAEHAVAVASVAKVQRLLGRPEETAALLHRELEALGEEVTPACAMLKFEVSTGLLHRGDPDGAYRAAEEVLAIAAQLRHRPLQASALGVMAMAASAVGRPAPALDHHASATATLDSMLDSELAQSLDATVWIGWSGVLLERWNDALRHFHKGAEFATRSGSRLFLPHLLAGQAYVLCERARLAEARSTAEHAVYLAELSGSPEALVNSYAILAYVDIAQGRRVEALTSAGKATVQPPRSAGGWKEMMALRALSEAKLLNGDAESCLALIAKAGGPDLPQADAGSRVAWYELLTRAELALGQPEAARVWADRAWAAAARLDKPGRYALAELARAHVLLARQRADAVPTAQQAVQGLELAGRSLDALRARVVLGAALWQQGRHEEAGRELKSAESALNQLGAPVLARAARSERRRLAAGAPRTRPGDSERTVTALTGRERQIAGLLGDGLTNRQIAKCLHISEKTVEMHLSNVFAKLGVANRAAVSAIITRERLEGDPVPVDRPRVGTSSGDRA